MSKRKYAQAKRRQVRRALNKAVDFLKQIGASKARTIRYGDGLMAKAMKEHSTREDSDATQV